MNIEPVQKTIGVVSIKRIQLTGMGAGRLRPKKLIPTGEYRKIGIERISEIKNRWRISASICLAICGFVMADSWSVWLTFEKSCPAWGSGGLLFGISSIPHPGHLPGAFFTTSGCMGQV